VKYEVEGEGKALTFWNQAYPTLKLMNHVLQEHVGKPTLKDGVQRTPVTLQFLVDRETFKRLKNASFRSPYRIPTHREEIGPELVESITIWMNVKTYAVGEKRVPGSENITAAHLSIYRAKEVAIQRDGYTYYLVGDAAFGVPFFRACNNGLQCGSILSHAMSDQLNGTTASVTRALEVDDILSSTAISSTSMKSSSPFSSTKKKKKTKKFLIPYFKVV